MISIIDQISVLLFISTSIGVVLITSINLYLQIRKRFPKTVNCWFCNTNTSVPYERANSWDCPACEQYNGFTKDGDYNKEIPGQRNAKLNSSKNSCLSEENFEILSNKSRLSNGLCSLCNRNQKIKVQQLATFIPNNEEEYDEEIEEYTKQLEKLYRLCPRCERVVKRTLNKVKSNILGSKLAQLKNLHTNLTKDIVKNKYFSITLVVFVLIILSIINLIIIFNKLNFNNFNVILNYDFVSYFDFLINIYQKIYSHLVEENLSYFKEVLQNYDFYFITNLFGIVLTISLIIINDLYKSQQLITILLWNINLGVPIIEKYFINYFNLLCFDLVKILIGLLIIFTSIKCLKWLKVSLKNNTSSNNNKLNDSFHRIYTNNMPDVSVDEEDDDFDDDDDFSDISEKLNKTFNTTKSLSPSVFTPSTLLSHITPSVISQSYYSNNNNNNKINNPNYFRTIPFEQQNNHNNMAYNMYNNVNNNNNTSDIPDDFQSGITSLTLNESLLNQRKASSFQNENTQMNNRRDNILTPSKLFLRQTNNCISPIKQQTSWLAGGYWNSNNNIINNNTMPQISPNKSLNIDFCPIMSRTSSQSSGFESQTSSNNFSINRNNNNVNGINHLNNSRESSICGDIDRSSVISEPAFYLSQNHNQNYDKMNTKVINNRKIHTVHPLLQHTNNYPIMQSPPSYLQHKQQRFGDNNFHNTAFNFKKLSSHLPNIEKGSLLKDWNSKTMDFIAKDTKDKID